VAVLGLGACCTNHTVPVGGACSLDDACATGVCIPGTDASGRPTAWPDGYCSGNCESVACPQGSCLAMADGHSYCVSTCNTEGDCRPGYVCAEAVAACLPDCRKGWSCGSALACNSANGHCEAAP
jgi:hypothetical protein